MNAMTKIKSYVDVGMETNVSSADPHKLILLLYQGALLAIASARNHMLRKEIALKGKSVSHAITIIDEGLKASLNQEAGGDLAGNLASLYEYMSRRLLQANLENDPAILDEVSGLLTELRSAWENIRKPNAPAVETAAPQPAPAKTAAYGVGLAAVAPRVYERA
ncbi:MAG: flagellar export chaperone FliS [Betaproteobacteria bacterium]|nr:flagellar export chaperone FliS [Betaproteobacteria bacterium]